MARKCDYCGAKVSSLVADAFGGVRGERKVTKGGKKYIFCSSACFIEFTKQRQQNLTNSRIVEEQKKRKKDDELKKKELDRARSYKVLQKDIDFLDWYSSCDSCDEQIISPKVTDECEDCGADRTLELRQYADGYKRVLCCCKVCKTEVTIRGLDCNCGGRASAAKTVIVDSDGNENHGEVIFKSPKNIGAQDYVVDPNSLNGSLVFEF